MSKVLYRKYRASRFADMHGQTTTIALLKQALSSGKFSHAYLFAGPRGTGKTSMARLVAKALNCEKYSITGEICNECPACLAIESGSFVDLFEIDAASNRGIDEIRQIKENLQLAPVAGKFKIYIIDEVHMLTKEAFNALLKTIEEPPAHVIFILATTEVHKIPITILSRVQRYDFRFATEEELVTKLSKIAAAEGIEIEEEAMKLIYRKSQGSFRDAESLLDKLILNLGGESRSIGGDDVKIVLGLANQEVAKEVIEAILAGDRIRLFAAIDTSLSGGAQPIPILELVLESLHNMLYNSEESDVSRIIHIMTEIMKWLTEIRISQRPELILRLALAATITTTNINTQPKPAEKPTNKGATQNNYQSTDSTGRIEHSGVKTQQQTSVKAEEDTHEPSKLDLLKQNILNLMRKTNFSAWMQMRMCEISVEGSRIVVSSPYSATIKMLEEELILGLIAKAAEPFVPNPEVVVKFIGNISPIEDSSVGEPLPTDSKSQENIDNVNLVEEIF